MRLKETDPDQFNTYVQMAADAAQLAKEQPEVFQALMQEKAAGMVLPILLHCGTPSLLLYS